MMHSAVPRSVEMIAAEWIGIDGDMDRQAAGIDLLRREIDALCELQALVQDADLIDVPVEYLVALVRAIDGQGWIVGGSDLESEVPA